jgi:transcriptional regulator with XRE-family HTH domain
MQYTNGSLFVPTYARLYSPQMSLANRLDEAMKEAREHGVDGISQSKLKEISGVPQATISRTLKGQTSPETATIRRLASALNVTFEWLNEGILPKYRHEKVENVASPVAQVQLVGPAKPSGPTPEDYAEIVRLFGQAPPSAQKEALRLLGRAIKAAGGVHGAVVRNKPKDGR